MNKENVLSKKINVSQWKSPKVNKKQYEKRKEQMQNSSEKRGLHIKSLSDNNILEFSPLEKSDLNLSFIKEEDSNGHEQFIQKLIKKIEFYEGFLTKSQIQEENKLLQEKLAIAIKKNDELSNSLNQKEIDNAKINKEFLEVKKEKDELVDDISNLNDVVNMLVERENWIPPEEVEEKIEEALIAAGVKSGAKDNHEKEYVEASLEDDSSKMKASNDSLNTLVSGNSNKESLSEYEVMINDLKKQVENLTLALNEKNEALEKKQSETKELYDEIKEYHEVFDALKEREDWVSPEEVEEIRSELYDVVVQKGFIETELQEKKELIEELKKQLLA